MARDCKVPAVRILVVEGEEVASSRLVAAAAAVRIAVAVRTAAAVEAPATDSHRLEDKVVERWAVDLLEEVQGMVSFAAGLAQLLRRRQQDVLREACRAVQ